MMFFIHYKVSFVLFSMNYYKNTKHVAVFCVFFVKFAFENEIHELSKINFLKLIHLNLAIHI